MSGTLTRRYAHNVGADVPVLSYEYVSGVLSHVRYPHADHQGSIVALSDDYGAATYNSYDEYGIPASGNTGRFQYTGQIWLPELGMYHYKARVYSPTLGRFLQTDPIGYEDQFNLYAYVGNDPVNMTDPMGTQSRPPQCNAAGGRIRCDTPTSTEERSELITEARGRTIEDPQSEGYATQHDAGVAWARAYEDVLDTLGDEEELVSGIFTRNESGLWSFTIPERYRLGPGETVNLPFSERAVNGRFRTPIHSHDYPGGFSVADIGFARRWGYYLREPGSGGGVLRYLSPNRARRAEQGELGDLICARIRHCTPSRR